jgi:hypothetical protein
MREHNLSASKSRHCTRYVTGAFVCCPLGPVYLDALQIRNVFADGVHKPPAVRPGMLFYLNMGDSVPSLNNSFGLIKSMLSAGVQALSLIEQICQTIPNVNFSSDICEPMITNLRV